MQDWQSTLSGLQGNQRPAASMPAARPGTQGNIAYSPGMMRTHPLGPARAVAPGQNQAGPRPSGPGGPPASGPSGSPGGQGGQGGQPMMPPEVAQQIVGVLMDLIDQRVQQNQWHL